MILLLGIKKNTDLDVRAKFAIAPSRQRSLVKKLNEDFNEAVIVSTCNRTEIYVNADDSLESNYIIHKIFEDLQWDYEKLSPFIFLSKEDDTIYHLMEVICGFHSRILGEDQILGQIKDSYILAKEENTIGQELQKLFEEALSCGKKFRTQCKIFEVPVSSVSISIAEALEHNAKNFMVLGYGEMGKLAVKYILGHDIEKLYIVVRNKLVVNDLDDQRVSVINFAEKNDFLNKVDAVISCTAATHTLINKEDIKEEGKDIYIFDLAVPRDVDSNVSKIDRVKLYDLDYISSIDDRNKAVRKERMEKFRYIIDEKIDEYNEWLNSRKLSPIIIKLKMAGDETYLERAKTFTNKSKGKEDLKLAKTLIKSASHTYINRAIEVLKEESLNGRQEECLEIINKIFLQN
ncbi:MAG: glutamyl-tRNA reductase [Clostridium perfringens]|nr:glutamyl-tRNA reductase [Clostridium perfringens]